MKRSFGLFRAAITESGGFSQWVAKELPRAQANYEWVMSNLGLAPDDVDTLVSLPAKKILTAAQYYNPGCPWPDTMVQSQFAPVIDGVELTAQPSVLAAAGKVAPGVSVIFGSNRDEGTMFVSNNFYSNQSGHYSGADLPRSLTHSQFVNNAYGSWGAIVGRMMTEKDMYVLVSPDIVPSFSDVACLYAVRYPLKCKRRSLEYELCPIGTYNTWWWAATR